VGSLLKDVSVHTKNAKGINTIISFNQNAKGINTIISFNQNAIHLEYKELIQ
jgi:hypothetical protein